MNARTMLGAGTALAMLMTTAAVALPGSAGLTHRPDATERPVVLAQAATVDELRRRLAEEELTDAQRAEIEAQIRQLESAPAAPEAPAQQPAAPEAPAEPAPAPEQPAPAPEQPAPEPTPAPEQPPAGEAPAQQPAAPEAPAEQPTAEPAPEQPAPEQPAPAPEQPAAQEAPAEQPAAEEAPAEQPAAEPAPAPEQPAAEPTPTERPASEPAPAPEQPAAEEAPAEQPAAEEAPAEQPAAGEAPAEQPAAAEPAEPTAPVAADPAQDPEGVLPENATPVLDSAKEAPAEQPAGEAAAPAQSEEPAAPPPATDAEAQAAAQPAEVESVTAAEGQRVEAAEIERRRQEPERREGEQFIRELGGRLLFELGRQMIVQSDDRDRIGRGSRDVYYEDLRGGWTRETIVRENGSRVVTIRDRYGDVVRRSRITPDGREYVLVYAGDRDRDREPDRQWRDPGRDLPPLRLRIPVSEYILDARRARDAEDYYRFLDRPPVEPVRRLYSIDEVKYSARIRDTVRRVDLDTLTFALGSAGIEESEVGKLQAVADAMARMLEENPAETFLIEGHTDAVGTDQANLALSDRRAETVAQALTDVFDIPPENLVTQGYGERYLKVATQEPSRDNRRVAIRRITPLVAPVASAN